MDSFKSFRVLLIIAVLLNADFWILEAAGQGTTDDYFALDNVPDIALVLGATLGILLHTAILASLYFAWNPGRYIFAISSLLGLSGFGLSLTSTDVLTMTSASYSTNILMWCTSVVILTMSFTGNVAARFRRRGNVPPNQPALAD